MLTFYNLLNSVAWVAGSLVGGVILFSCGTSYHGYLLLFGLSSLGRLFALGLLARTQSRPAPAVRPTAQPALARPNPAAPDAPPLANLPDEARDAWAHTAS
jgi:hypothetical protein